jgi:hypothetical protein
MIDLDSISVFIPFGFFPSEGLAPDHFGQQSFPGHRRTVIRNRYGLTR